MGKPNGVNRRRDALPVGTELAAYEIEAIVGAGGFGVVYRARHQLLDSVVALKEYYPVELAVREGKAVHPRSADYREAFEDGLYRFRDEAKSLIELNDHPAIVGCRDFFLANGTAYLVMEYVDGEPLSGLLLARERAGRPFDETDLLAVVEPLLEGLGHVHSAGVVHRDIKPSNILIRRLDERPILIDFGAAKQKVADYTKSLAPYTDGFAAMEQVAEGEIGPWTDLYAIGAVMWRMVAGGHASLDSPKPVKVERRANAQLRGAADPLPSVRRLGWGRFSEQVLTAIEGCLQLNATERPQACSEVLGALRESAQPQIHESPTTQRAVPLGQSKQGSKASRGVVFAVLVVMAILGLASLPVFPPPLVDESGKEREVVSQGGEATPQPSPIRPNSDSVSESERLQHGPSPAEPPPDPTERNENAKAEREREPTGPQRVRMVTSKGEIVLELYPERAPETVENFLQYVDEKFYDGTIFHRVIPRFMIQGGGFTPNMREKSTRAPVKNEAGSLSNLRYTIAMARTANPHSATAQFFINHVTNRALDRDQARDGWGYCVFGKVIEGSEVVDDIARAATGAKAGHKDVPVSPIVIESVHRSERLQHRPSPAEPLPDPTERNERAMAEREPESSGPQKVRMVTSKGEIVLELFPERAPETVENFLQYVDEKFYDGTIFHRVIPRFMIQGGGFTPNMREKSTRAPVKNEAGSLSNLRYTIAMARTAAPHSATAQFFINHVTNRALDRDQARDGWGYCVFGKVIEGSEVVEAIARVATGAQAGHRDVPVSPIVIESVHREG